MYLPCADGKRSRCMFSVSDAEDTDFDIAVHRSNNLGLRVSEIAWFYCYFIDWGQWQFTGNSYN